MQSYDYHSWGDVARDVVLIIETAVKWIFQMIGKLISEIFRSTDDSIEAKAEAQRQQELAQQRACEKRKQEQRKTTRLKQRSTTCNKCKTLVTPHLETKNKTAYLCSKCKHSWQIRW